MSTNGNGDAPFHTACGYSKISLINRLYRCNGLEQTAKNSSQMAGNNYIIILKLFEPFKQFRVDFPVESYSKVFLCGNTTNGNSSSTLPS